MSDEHHAELLQLQKADLGVRTPFCPEDQQIAEYFDGGLPAVEKASLERHLAECRDCRARVGVIQRMEAGPADLRIPGEVLASARQIAGPPVTQRIRAAPAWAAAALLVVSLALFMNDRPGTSQALPEAAGTGDETRLIRSASPVIGGIQVLNPAPGAAVRQGATLKWITVPDSLHYDVFVQSRVGDVILTERVREAHWTVDRALSERAQGPYYFRVVAYLPDGRKLQSRHVPFELRAE